MPLLFATISAVPVEQIALRTVLLYVMIVPAAALIYLGTGFMPVQCFDQEEKSAYRWRRRTRLAPGGGRPDQVEICCAFCNVVE
jgi:hypothetical protein